MRTNAPEEYHVDGGAPALLGSFVVVGPSAVSSKSSCSSVLRDEEYELATKEGTLTFLNLLGGGVDQSKSSLKPICFGSPSPYRCDRIAQVRSNTSWR